MGEFLMAFITFDCPGPDDSIVGDVAEVLPDSPA